MSPATSQSTVTAITAQNFQKDQSVQGGELMRTIGKILMPAILLLGWAVTQNKTIVLSDTPNYDRSRQQVFTGYVRQVHESLCPVAGTVGSRIAVGGPTATVDLHM